ncbi:hypothetical protein GCM10017559_15670 [Streptosporangium longisporum]|uniref:Uncharacterized protein n=1 Tax=Streptosporangium longisporum TaxID=46187 RepID=A0ABN3XVP9_9ACTN
MIPYDEQGDFHHDLPSHRVRPPRQTASRSRQAVPLPAGSRSPVACPPRPAPALSASGSPAVRPFGFRLPRLSVSRLPFRGFRLPFPELMASPPSTSGFPSPRLPVPQLPDSWFPAFGRPGSGDRQMGVRWKFRYDRLGVGPRCPW